MKLYTLFRIMAALAIVLGLGIGTQSATAQGEPPVRLNYEIFIFDMRNGTTKQLTNMPGSEQYNPEWSPDGKWVVHDAWHPNDNYQEMIITEVSTGISKPLPGGAHGNDPDWSPNGQLIAFDSYWDGNLYTLPPNGGEPTLVRLLAGCVSWAPNSRRLAFTDWWDGTIRTSELDGSDETMIDVPGLCPKWSPNGQWLVYLNWLEGAIYKVEVNMHGDQLSEPILVLAPDPWLSPAKWSVDSKALIFTTGVSGAGDIWAMPAAGGAGTRLTGLEDFGDYDPAFSNDGRFIAYAAAIPAP